jgi:hypothetical protein
VPDETILLKIREAAERSIDEERAMTGSHNQSSHSSMMHAGGDV